MRFVQRHWQYSLSNKTDSAEKKEKDFRLSVCAACNIESPGKSKALFFRGVFALPSPASSSDLIKQKNRMESLPLLLHSAGIIRPQNKLESLIQLS